MKALRRLEETGYYVLPEPITIHRSGSPQRMSELVPFPVNVPDRVDDLSEFKLIFSLCLNRSSFLKGVIMKKLAVCAIALSLMFFSTRCFAEPSYKIGVLAKNGPVAALKTWKSTGDYLSSKL